MHCDEKWKKYAVIVSISLSNVKHNIGENINDLNYVIVITFKMSMAPDNLGLFFV